MPVIVGKIEESARHFHGEGDAALEIEPAAKWGEMYCPALEFLSVASHPSASNFAARFPLKKATNIPYVIKRGDFFGTLENEP
jgi:hypothetical protein